MNHAAAAQDKKNILKVSELTKEINEKVLEAAFVPFGPLISVEIPKDYHSRTFCDVVLL